MKLTPNYEDLEEIEVLDDDFYERHSILKSMTEPPKQEVPRMEALEPKTVSQRKRKSIRKIPLKESRITSKVRRAQCQICKKKINRSLIRYLFDHARRHHPKYPFGCEDCEETFFRFDGLEKHQLQSGHKGIIRLVDAEMIDNWKQKCVQAFPEAARKFDDFFARSNSEVLKIRPSTIRMNLSPLIEESFFSTDDEKENITRSIKSEFTCTLIKEEASPIKQPILGQQPEAASLNGEPQTRGIKKEFDSEEMIEINHLKTELEQKEREIQKLKQQNEKEANLLASNQIDNLKAELEQKEREIQKLKEHENEANLLASNEINHLKTELEQKERGIQKLKEQNERTANLLASNEINHLKSLLLEKERENQELVEQKAKLLEDKQKVDLAKEGESKRPVMEEVYMEVKIENNHLKNLLEEKEQGYQKLLDQQTKDREKIRALEWQLYNGASVFELLRKELLQAHQTIARMSMDDMPVLEKQIA